MATEGRCPVCGEGFTDRPPRCFRCETALGYWWRFEDELHGLATVSTSPARRPHGAFVLAVGLGLPVVALAVALLTRPLPLEEPPRPTPPAATGSTAPSVAMAPRPEGPVSVRYTVQRGDSPWRIAAALTGHGQRWRELWPGPPPKLLPGMVLDVPLRSDPR